MFEKKIIKVHNEVRWNYYKLRQLSPISKCAAFLLQSATLFITNSDRYYKVR